jgi:hypothetical protein
MTPYFFTQLNFILIGLAGKGLNQHFPKGKIPSLPTLLKPAANIDIKITKHIYFQKKFTTKKQWLTFHSVSESIPLKKSMAFHTKIPILINQRFHGRKIHLFFSKIISFRTIFLFSL